MGLVDKVTNEENKELFNYVWEADKVVLCPSSQNVELRWEETSLGLFPEESVELDNLGRNIS